MPSWVVQASQVWGVAFGTSVTRYIPPFGHIYDQPTETWAVMAAYQAYTTSNLQARATANTLTAASTLRSRRNSLNGNQLLTIPAGTTGLFEDAVNSDVLVAGVDTYCSQLITGATGTSVTLTIVSLLMFLGSDNPQLGWNNGGGPWPIGGWSTVVTGGVNPNGSGLLYTFRAAATLSTAFISVESNTWNQAATWRTNINGAAGNISVAVPAATTGYFGDAVNTDSLAVGDTVYMQMAPAGAGAGNLQVRTHTVQSASVGRPTLAARDTIFAAGSTQYNPVEGFLLDGAAEVSAQAEANASIPARNFVAYSPAAGSGATVALRRNGADTLLQVTIPLGGVGAYEDLVNIVSLVAADLIDYRITIGATGTQGLSYVGFQQGPPAAAAAMMGGVADKMRLIGAI